MPGNPDTPVGPSMYAEPTAPGPIAPPPDARRRVTFTAVIAAVGALTAILVVRLQPPVFRAEANLVLPLGAAPGAAQQLTPASGGLLQRGATPLDFLAGLLQSRRTLDGLAKESGLRVAVVERMYKVTPLTNSNQIQVRVEHNDRDLAQRLVTKSLTDLSALNREITLALAEEQAKNLKAAVAAKENDLKGLERQIVSLQRDATSPINPETPYVAAEAFRALFEAQREVTVAEAAVEAKRRAATASGQSELVLPESAGGTEFWRKTLDEAEIKYRQARAEFTPESPRYRKAKDEYEQTKAQFREAVRRAVLAVQTDVDPDMAELVAKRAVAREVLRQARAVASVAPVESAEVQKLIRQIELANRVYGQVRLRYEEAVLAAIVGETRWSVLVPPFVWDEPVNKGLFTPALLGLVSGGIMGWLIGGLRPRKA